MLTEGCVFGHDCKIGEKRNDVAERYIFKKVNIQVLFTKLMHNTFTNSVTLIAQIYIKCLNPKISFKSKIYIKQ